jgi:cation diffusion facilitator family transporter
MLFRAADKGFQHMGGLLEFLDEVLVFLVAPGVAQSGQLTVQHGHAVAQFFTELFEVVRKAADFCGIDNRLGHGGSFDLGHTNRTGHSIFAAGAVGFKQNSLYIEVMKVNSHPRYPMVLSIGAALVTLGIKAAAYGLTGSVGLLSDAVESLVNLVAALTALFCLWFAARPVDVTHTYGHEKIEYFSSGWEGLLILLAACSIAWYAVLRLFEPKLPDDLEIGMILCLGASVVNFVVALVLLRVGKKTQSIVLEADGKHLMTDVWTSVGVVVGLLLVRVTGWTVLDPVIALLVAANILWTALDLMRRSFNGLMDHALPESEQAALRVAIEKKVPRGVTYHAMRTRQAGARRFVDFHLLVPGAWSVQEAHDLTGQVEAAIKNEFPAVEVTVHIEPIEEPAAWKDSELLPLEHRQATK